MIRRAGVLVLVHYVLAAIPLHELVVLSFNKKVLK
jgi:hypothetical protein